MSLQSENIFRLVPIFKGDLIDMELLGDSNSINAVAHWLNFGENVGILFAVDNL